jgi:hypothetical protein
LLFITASATARTDSSDAPVNCSAKLLANCSGPIDATLSRGKVLMGGTM